MAGAAEDDGAMTITDYLINAMFLLVVARQARERELDRRSVIVPLILVFFVAQMYLTRKQADAPLVRVPKSPQVAKRKSYR